MIRHIALSALALSALASTTSADLVISQYYEGPGAYDKWIEVFNSGPSAVNLSNYAVGIWSNTNAEGYKTGVAPNAWDVLPNVSLPSGGVFLMSHDEAGIPLDLVAGFRNSNVLSFTGNDSFAIYSAGAYSTGSLVDAIGFTNTGNQGPDKGFVRLSLDQGYSLTAGSNVLNFGSVWQSIAFWQANIATAGMDAHLGSTSLVAEVAVAAIPEPTAALFGGLIAGVMGLTVARRPADRE
jgi:hypothetical protein